MIYDFCIIGGGIIGLATAHKLLEAYPDASLLLIEKETALASHQTGHNSGVIHAGIYYEPGSLKAKLCREGLEATVAFCKLHDLAYEQCGKLIVATNAVEETRLDLLYARANANGLKLRRISGAELQAIEPNIIGTAALLSAETGIVDYREIGTKLAELITAKSAEIILGSKVDRIIEQADFVEIGTKDSTWQAKKLIVCGGLQADRLAKLAGLPVDFRIVPFRGEYFKLPADKNNIIQHLIYPVPDPSLPFLGVHLTRMIDGSVTVGPNAVLGLAREGYPKLSINLRDMVSFVFYAGFWKLIWEHRRHTIHELKGSISRAAYLKDCRKYCPELRRTDLLPYRAGIRAQVVTRAGKAVHDFMYAQTDRMLHIYNAPSPAATSALPIGEMIAQKCIKNTP
jgi:(S)-2-hydroxyglutarate dehydrogenase